MFRVRCECVFSRCPDTARRAGQITHNCFGLILRRSALQRPIPTEISLPLQANRTTRGHSVTCHNIYITTRRPSFTISISVDTLKVYNGTYDVVNNNNNNNKRNGNKHDVNIDESNYYDDDTTACAAPRDVRNSGDRAENTERTETVAVGISKCRRACVSQLRSAVRDGDWRAPRRRRRNARPSRLESCGALIYPICKNYNEIIKNLDLSTFNLYSN